MINTSTPSQTQQLRNPSYHMAHIPAQKQNIKTQLDETPNIILIPLEQELVNLDFPVPSPVEGIHNITCQIPYPIFHIPCFSHAHIPSMPSITPHTSPSKSPSQITIHPSHATTQQCTRIKKHQSNHEKEKKEKKKTASRTITSLPIEE